MSFSQSERLGFLAASRPDALKPFAEMLLPALEGVVVLKSRTGLVMLPMRDTAQGTSFHLGEVLMSEAHMVGMATAGSQLYSETPDGL